MNFLDKLDTLMIRDGYNKSSFSKACGIPYTTIDNWYKRGYEGLQLSTLMKINAFFGTTLEFWARDDVNDPNYGKSDGFKVDYDEMNHIKKYRDLDDHGKKAADSILNIEYERCMAFSKTQACIVPMRELDYLAQGASAGSGNYLFNDMVDTIRVRDMPEISRADLCVRVQGESMAPMFHDGDLALVHKQPTVEVGEIGIFIVDSDMYIKQCGGDRLISLNHRFPDVYPNEDNNVICVGKVLMKLDEGLIVE